MDTADEHQRRWIERKAPTAADLETVKLLKMNLQSTIHAAVQVFVDVSKRMTSSEKFAEFYADVDRIAEIARSLARLAHSAKAFCDWNVAPVPEFTDHFVNQYFLWPEFKRTFWLEGAVFCALAMKRGGRYLELCCGGGFFSDMFYASIARELVAIDFDPRAIELARRHHARDNVRYEIVDIREGLPEGPFDGVIWDGAIEHFSTDEIAVVMAEIKRKLVPGGFLSGYTIAESGDGMQHPDHEQEFRGMSDLGARLKPYFKNVLVFESIHATIAPMRHNLLFFAGDDTLPFDADWPNCLRL
jgi:SAM-dependent methyltransferase